MWQRTRMAGSILSVIMAAIVIDIAGPTLQLMFVNTGVPARFADVLLQAGFMTIAPWAKFFCLFVPDALLLAVAGFGIGRIIQEHSWRYIGLLLSVFVIVSTFRGTGPTQYLFLSVTSQRADAKIAYFCFGVLVIVSPGVGAWLQRRFFKNTPIEPGKCNYCKYPLVGLTSNICPECGTPFAARESTRCENEKYT